LQVSQIAIHITLTILDGADDGHWLGWLLLAVQYQSFPVVAQFVAAHEQHTGAGGFVHVFELLPQLTPLRIQDGDCGEHVGPGFGAGVGAASQYLGLPPELLHEQQVSQLPVHGDPLEVQVGSP